MKRYLLFHGGTYYPLGGWRDFVASFDSVEEAEKAANEAWHEWFQIVDTGTWVIAKEFYLSGK